MFLFEWILVFNRLGKTIKKSTLKITTTVAILMYTENKLYSGTWGGVADRFLSHYDPQFVSVGLFVCLFVCLFRGSSHQGNSANSHKEI